MALCEETAQAAGWRLYVRMVRRLIKQNASGRRRRIFASSVRAAIAGELTCVKVFPCKPSPIGVRFNLGFIILPSSPFMFRCERSRAPALLSAKIGTLGHLLFHFPETCFRLCRIMKRASLLSDRHRTTSSPCRGDNYSRFIETDTRSAKVRKNLPASLNFQRRSSPTRLSLSRSLMTDETSMNNGCANSCRSSI